MDAYGMWYGNILKEIDGVSFDDYNISTTEIRSLRQQNLNLSEQNAELKEQLFNTVAQLSEQMRLAAQQSEMLKGMDRFLDEAKVRAAAAFPQNETLAIAFPENATRVIGQEQGYQPLPIVDLTFDCPINGPNTPLMITAWFPNQNQIAKLIEGAAITVQIIGNQHPPLIVAVGEPNERS